MTWANSIHLDKKILEHYATHTPIDRSNFQVKRCLRLNSENERTITYGFVCRDTLAQFRLIYPRDAQSRIYTFPWAKTLLGSPCISRNIYSSLPKTNENLRSWRQKERWQLTNVKVYKNMILQKEEREAKHTETQKVRREYFIQI